MKKKITDFIPHERLQIYLNLYKFIRSFQVPEDFPYKEVGKILIALSQLVDKGYLNKTSSEEAYNLIFADIYEVMNYAPLVRRALVKRGAPRRNEEDVLIYCLVEDIKYMTGKPQYELVTAFLKEKDIFVEQYSSDNIRKRYEKLQQKKDDFIERLRMILSFSILPNGELPISLFDGMPPIPTDHPFFKLILPERK